MKSFLRLAFVLPALLVAAPVSAVQPAGQLSVHPSVEKAPMRYVTLDFMIRTFAAQARAERDVAARTAVIAAR